MGEMAELAAEEYYASLAELKLSEKQNKRFNPYKTENVLNNTFWIDGYGTKHELENMDKDHLQNVLYFLYRKRDRYWLNCNDVSLIEKFKDGDDFFQRVIRKSTLWKAILDTLEKPEEAFNFKISE
ncbi:hypothetical protein ACDX78_02305 [Virgibacillus oceani]